MLSVTVERYIALHLEMCTGDRNAVARHTLALSTYLGHAHVADTYWYFQATPKLLASPR
jgi:hypothetical protein